MRKSYGTTWWGQQWLNALKNIDFSNRLPRGRTYANKGMVSAIQIEGNRISAKVQGSRAKPYKVDISVPTFTPNTKAKIIALVTSNPIFLSRLLNRELPNELHDRCREQSIDLFPHSWKDLKGGCSCPDWAVPCKHMAAVLYLVANEIDKNPFLVFELHDFDLFQGLAGIGYTTEQEKDIPIPAAQDLRYIYQSHEGAFQWDTAVFSALDFSVVPDCKDQLLTLLKENAVFFRSGDFKAILNKMYTNVLGIPPETSKMLYMI